MAPDSGNAAVNWQGFVNQILQGGIDIVKLKHLGVPTVDSRVPDQADLYYGNAGPPARTPAWLWPAVAAVVLVIGVAAVIRLK